MPDFVGTMGTPVTPFGVNEFLRSWQDIKTESYTVSSAAMPVGWRDGNFGQKILQPGTVMAKITSGPEAGKIGVYQPAGTAEVQTLTKGTGTYTAGTYLIGVTGSNNPADTATLAFDATAAQLTTVLQTFPALSRFVPVATGGPIGTGAFTITDTEGGDMPQITIDTTNVTGQTGASTAATGTGGAAGSVDGRGTAANIVGILLTAVPWQLTQRDVEVSVVYEASVVQGWCIEYNAAGSPVPLSNTTAAFLIRGGGADKSIDVSFH